MRIIAARRNSTAHPPDNSWRSMWPLARQHAAKPSKPDSPRAKKCSAPTTSSARSRMPIRSTCRFRNWPPSSRGAACGPARPVAARPQPRHARAGHCAQPAGGNPRAPARRDQERHHEKGIERALPALVSRTAAVRPRSTPFTPSARRCLKSRRWKKPRRRSAQTPQGRWGGDNAVSALLRRKISACASFWYRRPSHRALHTPTRYRAG